MTDNKEKVLLGYIQKVLISGVASSFVTMFVGMLFKSSLLLSTGVLILIMTPVLRILLLSIGFYILGEFFLSLSAFSVLVIILIAVLI